MQKDSGRNIKGGTDPKPKDKKPYVRPELVKKEKLAEVTGGTPPVTS